MVSKSGTQSNPVRQPSGAERKGGEREPNSCRKATTMHQKMGRSTLSGGQVELQGRSRRDEMKQAFIAENEQQVEISRHCLSLHAFRRHNLEGLEAFILSVKSLHSSEEKA